MGKYLIWHRLNPQTYETGVSRYVQGMNDLAVPFFTVFLSPYCGDDPEAINLSSVSPDVLAQVQYYAVAPTFLTSVANEVSCTHRLKLTATGVQPS